MAVIVNGDGILTGVSSLTTALDDLTSGRGTITGVTTVGTLQLGTGVSISSPRSQQAAIFTNNTEFLTVDDAGRVGIAITNPTTKFDVNGTSKFQDDVTFTGASANITFDKSTDDLIFDDNAQAKFGTGGDLSIFHNGTHSFIQETGAGALQIRGANLILDNADGSKRYIDCNDGGSVELYYNNSKKFETSSIGWKSEDSVKGIFGTDGDFQIFHNGSNSFVKKLSSGTGQLYLDSEGSSDLYLRAGDGSSGTNISMRCYSNAGVDLRYQGTKKFETTSSGVTVAAGSDIRFTNGTWTGEVAGKIQHNSNNLYIQGGTGGIRFRHASSGVNQFSMTNGGNFEITNGNLVVASGHGIDFSANTDGGGTSSATLLEDYEEGSYTITSNTNLTLDNNRTGYYTKVGNMVTVTGYLSLNTNDGSPSVSGSNNIVLSLPYAVNTSSGTYTGTMLQQNIDSDTPTSSVGHPLWYKTLPVDYVCLAASDGLRFYINYMEAAYTRMNNSHLHVGYPGYTYIAWNITYRTN